MNVHKFLPGNGIYSLLHAENEARDSTNCLPSEKRNVYIDLSFSTTRKGKGCFSKPQLARSPVGAPMELQQAINEVYDSVCEDKSTSFRTHFLTNSRIYFCRFEKLRTFPKSLSTNSPNRSSFLFFLSTSRFSSPTASRAYTHTPPHTHSANFRFLPSPFTS